MRRVSVFDVGLCPLERERHLADEFFSAQSHRENGRMLEKALAALYDRASQDGQEEGVLDVRESKLMLIG